MLRRKLVSRLFVGFCAGAVLLALIPLAMILFFVISQGVRALDLDFFTRMPTPVGEPGGGMANSIVGTLILTALGSLMAIPIGVLSGLYMSDTPAPAWRRPSASRQTPSTASRRS